MIKIVYREEKRPIERIEFGLYNEHFLRPLDGSFALGNYRTSDSIQWFSRVHLGDLREAIDAILREEK